MADLTTWVEELAKGVDEEDPRSVAGIRALAQLVSELTDSSETPEV